MRPTPQYEVIQSFVEELDGVLQQEPVDITRARGLVRGLSELTEHHAAMLKTIHDIAEQGTTSVRTQRWVDRLQKGEVA